MAMIAPVIIPQEILNLEPIFDPYFKNGCMDESAPKEAVEAYEIFKKWFWEQDQ